MREYTIENLEEKFDDLFRDLDKLNDDFTERNSISMKQIMEAYEESKN